jgi:signal transduction histidine kinase
MKNQLGIILGFSELLLQEMEAEDTRRSDVAEIHRAAKRAMELMDDARPQPDRELA